MNIVLVTTEYQGKTSITGGLGSFTANLANGLVDLGHKVIIIVAGTSPRTIEADNSQIEVHNLFVPKQRWKFYNKCSALLGVTNETKRNHIRYCLNNYDKSFQVSRLLKKINRNNKIDIVHYCNLDSLFLFHNKTIPYVVRMSSYIYCSNKYMGEKILDSCPDEKYLYREKMQDLLLRRVKHVISPSYNIANDMRNRLSIDADIIESPFSLNKYNFDYSIAQTLKKKYVLFFGRLAFIKGIDVLVPVAKEFLEKYPDYSFIIVGNEDKSAQMSNGMGTLEYIYSELSSFGSNYIYLGGLPREQLYPIIENAEVSFLPYRYENLSNACIESMALGTIVVGTNGASFEQLIEDGVNGYLGERGDYLSYYNALERAVSMSKDERNLMISQAKKTIERLSIDTITNQYVNYYEKVIGNWE